MSDVNNFGTEPEKTVDEAQTTFDPNAMPNYEMPAEPEKKGMSIASLVLGICGVLGCCSPIVGIICGILAIVFGVKGKQQNPDSTQAKVGFILGIVFLILSIVNWIAGTILNLSLTDF